MKFLFLILLFTLSCSKQSPSRKLDISRASITDADFKGGVLFRMTNLTSSVVTTVELTAAPFTVLIADGKWKFEFVGFMGSTPWSGSTLCGETTVELLSTSAYIDISPNAANCATPEFVALVSTKVTGSGVWDTAQWDSPNSTWGP